MSIERFREAQNAASAGFETALEEVRAGAKRSHWIWYVFPQIGLGSSEPSRRFALHGEAEAAEFLRDPELRARLLTITSAVLEQLGRERRTALRTVMGSAIDATKLVSSMTLFRHVAERLQDQDQEQERRDAYAAIARAAGAVLARAAEEGYPPDAYTLRRLGVR